MPARLAGDAMTASPNHAAGEPADTALPFDPAWTSVALIWLEKRVEHWIRFGAVAGEQIIDRRRRVVAFAPGAVFAFVRWASSGYGTIVSRLDILRAVESSAPCVAIPSVTPGGESLLRLDTWSRVSPALEAIDAVQQLGIDPADACPDHWRHVMNRIAGGEPPRAYAADRHRAWLLRRRIAA